MKVLHIYAGNLFGGIETFLITLARAQHPHLESHFALCFEGRLSQELRQLKVPVHSLGEVRFSRIWTVWRSQQQLKALIKQENFDVIVCHACWNQAIFGGTAKALKPLVFWCHDAITGGHWLDRLAQLVQPHWAIANSKYTQKFLNAYYPQVSTDIIYCPVYPLTDSNPLDPANLGANLRRDLDTSLDKVVIIQLSRLERWKGQSLLLAALGNLNDLKTWECWIVGGAQRSPEEIYLQELKTQAQDLGIGDRIKFLGQRSDVPNLLKAADIHCQPNLGPEPFGISFIEALYAGLPVVTTAMGGGAEIVNSSCGVLVEPNNVVELSRALRSLINNKTQRQELGSHGYARAVELCYPSARVEQMYEVFQKAIAIT
jgi:glycosyltransferase involved in cell wall biosynthesis